MDSTVWGPKLWFVMHTFAYSYPDNPSKDEQYAMEQFFNNLKYTIPCNICRNHYKDILEKTPVSKYLSCRDELFKFTVDVHNVVNKSLGKPIYSYDDALKDHLSKYKPTEPKTHNTYMLMFFIALFIFICIYLKVRS